MLTRSAKGVFLAIVTVFVTAIVPAQSVQTGGQSETQSDALVLALTQSRKAMAGGDYDLAIRTLETIDRARKDPRVRAQLAVAHAKRGVVRFRAKKFDIAYRDFAAADRLAPGDETVLQNLGVVTFELRRTRQAERYMRRVLKLNPKNEQALVVLGRIAAERDDTKAASEYLGRAAKLTPGRPDYQSVADKLGKEAKVEEDFVTESKGHFRVQFERGKTTGVEAAVKSVHGYLDQAFDELKAALGTAPKRRITVVVYNKTQYRRVRSAHTWARAYYDGKLRVAVKDWPSGRNALRRDLRHELTHAFLHECYKDTPVWLHEGLAQMLEGASAGAATQKFRRGRYELLPAKIFTGRFTASADAKLVQRGYAQSLMLVGYLKQRGNGQLRRLLEDLSRGRQPEHALRDIYGEDLAGLLRAAMK